MWVAKPASSSVQQISPPLPSSKLIFLCFPLFYAPWSISSPCLFPWSLSAPIPLILVYFYSFLSFSPPSMSPSSSHHLQNCQKIQLLVEKILIFEIPMIPCSRCSRSWTLLASASPLLICLEECLKIQLPVEKISIVSISELSKFILF